ncbi:hypothetical protein OC842_000558 [Tilletia horrida]|uniref:Oxo-4-hydroxy-4-carboxy-5-ureidoimidazoline decarboxylase domain-containing protein n=1 Tax=Tilletia horrida TaxID=155126 RepID=A0AAN6GJ42_9BASI|nr:hypothetical protein OC842_000558 [Tilletia horrida]
MAATSFIAPSELADSPSVETIAPLLSHLLECPPEQLPILTEQSIAAINELPPNARPRSYEGLLDVARFIIEDEPGWSVAERARFVGGHPRIGAPLQPSAGQSISDASRAEQLKGGETTPETLARLERLNKLYELRFPALRFVTFVAGRSRAAVADEIEALLGPGITDNASIVADKPETFPEDQVKDIESEEWQDELVRAEDALWKIAADRIAKLHKSSPSPSAKAAAPSLAKADSKAAPPSAPAKASPPADPTAEEPFLSLASFRMLVLSSPVLESFFERDLSTSFILEPPERSASGGAYAWHAAPTSAGGPRAVPGDRKASIGAVSGPAGGVVEASYSRDITTGTKGRVVGFLGGLLGEEGKAKMTQLADTVAQRLQTHTVTGPKPSFGRTGGGVTLDGRRMDMGEMEEDERKRKEERAREMAAERKRGLAGRLAGALQGARAQVTAAATSAGLGVSSSGPTQASLAQGEPERGRPGAPAPSGPATSSGADSQGSASSILGGGKTSRQAKRTSLRGTDLSYTGPDGAAATLRQATAALLDDRSHFVIDEPGMAGGEGDGEVELEDDFVGDDVEEAALRKGKGSSSSGDSDLSGFGATTGGKLEGKAAQLAKDLRSAPPQ